MPHFQSLSVITRLVLKRCIVLGTVGIVSLVGKFLIVHLNILQRRSTDVDGSPKLAAKALASMGKSALNKQAT
jgi:hypothetical protein